MKKLFSAFASLIVIAGCACNGRTRGNAASEASLSEPAASEATTPVPGVGDSYVDIAGPDALDGEELSIKVALAEGKPVLVDFWASWCPPCRREIAGPLSNAAKLYKDKLTILGIAVWEDSVEDTRTAMKNLGVSWPVIFGGGRSDKTSAVYGVNAIPTMIGIGADGKIVAVSHSADEVLKALGLTGQ